MIELLIALGIGLLASAAVLRYVRLLDNALESRDFYVDKFLACVDRLVDNPELSEEDFDRLRGYTMSLQNPEMFFVVATAIDLTLNEIQQGVRSPRRIARPYDADWLEMFYLYVQAVSYMRPIRGIRLRAQFSRVLEPSISEESDRIIDRHMRGHLACA